MYNYRGCSMLSVFGMCLRSSGLTGSILLRRSLSIPLFVIIISDYTFIHISLCPLTSTRRPLSIHSLLNLSIQLISLSLFTHSPDSCFFVLFIVESFHGRHACWHSLLLYLLFLSFPMLSAIAFLSLYPLSVIPSSSIRRCLHIHTMCP